MELDLNMLRPQERLSLQLKMLYQGEGFQKYHMGRFEEYGLYQENRRFLSSEQVITFTDLDGRLLALKPDVTLSIAKNARVPEGGASGWAACPPAGRLSWGPRCCQASPAAATATAASAAHQGRLRRFAYRLPFAMGLQHSSHFSGHK